MSEKIPLSALQVLETVQTVFNSREDESDFFITRQNLYEAQMLLFFYEQGSHWLRLSETMRDALINLLDDTSELPETERLVVVQGLQTWLSDQTALTTQPTKPLEPLSF